ncbi:MAG: cytochrome c, partial [Gammaproteobacteria bacterium]|nr:cytochrome c [Gammaproteobacteria bacterium]
GRSLYVRYQCWQCHGYEGQGGAAPRVATSQYPFEAFARFVRYPNEMPAYTQELLSDEQLLEIFNFLASIPLPPDIDDIPALRDNT